MAFRRRRLLIPEHSDGGQKGNMEQLANKYMKMCKVESSTDSDSEISPRWSDTSTMECVSSAPESGTLKQTLPLVREPPGKHGCYSLFLDPYDGSSEDSDDTDAPSRRTRQQGKGGRLSRKNRRFILHHPSAIGFWQLVKTPPEQQHLVDVHMKCVEDSEVWLCELVSLSSQAHLYHGGPAEEMPTGSDVKVKLYDDDSSANPCNLRVLFKRKLAVPTAEGLELGHRKRQCVVNMEEGDSTWDAC